MKKPNILQRIIPPSIWKDPAKREPLTGQYLIVYSLGDGDLPVTGSGHYDRNTKKWYFDIDQKSEIEDGVFLFAELPNTPKGFNEDEMPVNDEDFKVERMLKKMMKDDPTFYIRRENFREKPNSNFYPGTQEAMDEAEYSSKEAMEVAVEAQKRAAKVAKEAREFLNSRIDTHMPTMREIEIAVGKRVIVKFKKLHENAVLPKYAKPGDAGMDLVPVNCESIEGNLVCSFGFAMQIPDGYVGLVFPRSGVYRHSYTMSNSVGVIDSGYRGEVKAIFKKFSNYAPSFYTVGQAVAQLIIMPYPQVETEWAEKLSETIRGEGGFGHTDFDGSKTMK